METLQITKEAAVHAFKNAEQEGKKLLSNLFGKNVFITNLREILFTWGDVFEYLDTTEAEAVPWPSPKNAAQVWLNTVEKLRLLYELLNGEKPDFSDSSTRKYRRWVEFVKDDSDPAGFRVVDTCTSWTGAYTNVGSRLCLHDDDDAEHVWQYFKEDILTYLNR